MNPGTSAVNKAIHHLAQRYCVDCRNAFEELSKIIQVKILGLFIFKVPFGYSLGKVE